MSVCRPTERETIVSELYVAWSELEPVIHPPPLCPECEGTGRFIGRSPEMGLNLDFAPCTACGGTGETDFHSASKSGRSSKSAEEPDVGP